MMYSFLLVFAYLCGSIPFGLIIAKTQGIADIRQHGSGNIGATNVLRTVGKKWGAITLLADLLKGLIPIVICKAVLAPPPMACGLYTPQVAGLVALAAVVGHVFPIWLKFKGGKGVATALGAFLGLSWPVGLISLATWLITAKLFRISSLSALIAMIFAPVWFFFIGDLFIVPTVISALIVVKHYANIGRLLKGTEPKIGDKKKG